LMAAVSGRAEVARTGATVKQKNDRVQRFLQRLYGFTEYLLPVLALRTVTY